MKSKLLSLLFFMVAFYGFAEPIIATTTNTFGTVETSKPTTSVSGLPYVITNSGGNYAESIGSSELSSTILTDICGNFFSDNGGPSGNYSVPSSDNITLTPSIPGGAVTVNFTIFSTVQFSDILRIYDGPDTNAPLLGGFSGTTNPGSFTSTHSSGALTFLFLAFSTTGAPGWIANVTCTPPPCVPPTNLMVTDIEFASATLQWFDSNTPNIGYEWVVMADNVAPNTALAVATGTIIGKEVPVSGLLTGTTYDFYVRTDCDFSIISSWSVVESFTTTDCVTPGNVAAINLTTTSADLTWDASPSEINGYEWVVMADGVAPDTITAQSTGTVGAGVLTTAFSGLTSYTTYDAYVRTSCG
ncbi:MAG: hypothetical protein HRT69_07875, partial [Flavobacteriaceae bacterium]|nr:hypothetical protein [Flavobacteriaceae bacterium]